MFPCQSFTQAWTVSRLETAKTLLSYHIGHEMWEEVFPLFVYLFLILDNFSFQMWKKMKRKCGRIFKDKSDWSFSDFGVIFSSL